MTHKELIILVCYTENCMPEGEKWEERKENGKEGEKGREKKII